MKNIDPYTLVEIEQSERIDFKKILYLLRRQWHWLALFGALGIIGAYLYTSISQPKYWISTTILVPEKSTELNINDIFKGGIDMPSNNIYNQIEIIKSYYTVNRALINLNWRTSWYEKDFFAWKGIYKKEPFEVQEAPNFINPKNIAIYITPSGGDNYLIKFKGIIYKGYDEIDVNYEGAGVFGQAFVHKYFNFTLQKKNNNLDIKDGRYYFIFNDLDDITKSYRARLEVNIKDKKSDIIECSIIGEQPKKEVEFLNELIRVYAEGKMDFQNEAMQRSLDFINNQLSGISDSLNTASTKFTEFRSKNNVIDLGAEGTMVMNNLKEIETERAKAQIQLDYFQNLLNYIESSNDLTQLVAPSVIGIQDASLNSLVLKLGELYNRRQIVSFSAKENNPTMVMIDKELRQTKFQLAENLRNLIDNATRNINSQAERQSKISVQLNKLPQKEQQMVNIQRQFNLTNEIYTFLLQKRAETNIALASTIPDVQVIDVARPESVYKTGLDNEMIIFLGFIMALALPIGYMIVINIFDDRIRAQNDIEKNTDIPILGNIIHGLSKSELAVYENPKSSIAESFRVLRTNLQYMLKGSVGNVISIHSTNPNEGKSFSSVNLAAILAMNNKKVLLIGADMRKPRQHKIFNLDNDKGLSTLLIGRDEIDQVIKPTIIENLFLLPSGPIPPNPAEILSTPEMKNLIDNARSQYDFIIIDNAPTSLVTDGHIVSQLSDLNIFILRYGVSHKTQIDLMNQYKSAKTIENMAILVNDIKTNAFGYSYYKYYQYESYQDTYYADDKKEIKTRRKKKIA